MAEIFDSFLVLNSFDLLLLGVAPGGGGGAVVVVVVDDELMGAGNLKDDSEQSIWFSGAHRAIISLVFFIALTISCGIDRVSVISLAERFLELFTDFRLLADCSMTLSLMWRFMG